MKDQLDPQIVNLAKAIRTQESGGKFDIQGDPITHGGTDYSSAGAYQWNNQVNRKPVALQPGQLPSTWKEHAQQVLGDANAPMTPENQNHVAYDMIKKYKDQGNDLGQIASIWNSGSPNGWKTNPNVDVYAKNVHSLYQKYQSENPSNPTPSGPPPLPTPSNQGGMLGRAVEGATIGAGTGALLGSSFPVVGTAIGAAGGAVLGGLSGAFAPSIPDSVVNPIESLGRSLVSNVGAGMSQLAGSPGTYSEDVAGISKSLPQGGPSAYLTGDTPSTSDFSTFSGVGSALGNAALTYLNLYTGGAAGEGLSVGKALLADQGLSTLQKVGSFIWKEFPTAAKFGYGIAGADSLTHEDKSVTAHLVDTAIIGTAGTALGLTLAGAGEAAGNWITRRMDNKAIDAVKAEFEDLTAGMNDTEKAAFMTTPQAQEIINREVGPSALSVVGKIKKEGEDYKKFLTSTNAVVERKLQDASDEAYSYTALASAPKVNEAGKVTAVETEKNVDKMLEGTSANYEKLGIEGDKFAPTQKVNVLRQELEDYLNANRLRIDKNTTNRVLDEFDHSFKGTKSIKFSDLVNSRSAANSHWSKSGNTETWWKVLGDLYRNKLEGLSQTNPELQAVLKTLDTQYVDLLNAKRIAQTLNNKGYHPASWQGVGGALAYTGAHAAAHVGLGPLGFFAGKKGEEIISKMAQKSSLMKLLSSPMTKAIQANPSAVISHQIDQLGKETPDVLKSLSQKKKPFFENLNKKAKDYVDEHGIGFSQTKDVSAAGDLSTKILNQLPDKGEMTKQWFEDQLKRGDVKQIEKDIISSLLKDEGDKINVADFKNKVQAELLPLKRTEPKNLGEYRGAEGRYEHINLPDNLRGDVSHYQENVYQSPIKTSAGETHFGSARDTPKNYFGHTRVEDMADDKTRRVIEVQSDLYQKGNLEKEIQKGLGTDPTQMEQHGYSKETITQAEKDYNSRKDLPKLQQYNNPTAHFRMAREEIRKAAQDGKTKLQFPTGDTAMKIEGLGETNTWRVGVDRYEQQLPHLTNDKLKVGLEINNQGNIKWIITDVLGDGKFKAIPKDQLTSTLEAENPTRLNQLKESFDISGKVDTNNPIYKFYNKDLSNYLKNSYGATPVTDANGVTWMEVDLTKKPYGKIPVEAFSMIPVIKAGAVGTALQQAYSNIQPKKDKKDNKKGLMDLLRTPNSNPKGVMG